MIGEGMRVRFAPSYLKTQGLTPREIAEISVEGTVTYINWEHRMFWVEYDSGGTKQMESFQFFDIGEQVTIIGRK